MKKTSKLAFILIILMAIFSLTSLFEIKLGGETIKLASLTIIIGIVAFFVTRKTNENKNEGLDIKTIPNLLKDRKIIFLVFMPMIINVICFVVAKLFVPEFVEHLKSRVDFLDLNKIPILIVELIMSALGEEIAWRAFFQKQISKSVPFLPSLIISAVLFAICHYTQGSLVVVLYDLLFIFINAIFYGIIFRKSDNAYVSTLAHFLANLLGIIAIMLL